MRSLIHQSDKPRPPFITVAMSVKLLQLTSQIWRFNYICEINTKEII